MCTVDCRGILSLNSNLTCRGFNATQCHAVLIFNTNPLESCRKVLGAWGAFVAWSLGRGAMLRIDVDIRWCNDMMEKRQKMSLEGMIWCVWIFKCPKKIYLQTKMENLPWPCGGRRRPCGTATADAGTGQVRKIQVWSSRQVWEVCSVDFVTYKLDDIGDGCWFWRCFGYHDSMDDSWP